MKHLTHTQRRERHFRPGGKTVRRLLAFALCSLIVVGLAGVSPADAEVWSETTADPVTVNLWNTTNFADDTRYAGRIWTDKSVSAGNMTFSEGGSVSLATGEDFLVALSAISSTMSSTTTQAVPLDIVLVLDVSGSMDDAMGEAVTTYEAVYSLDTTRNYYIQLANGQYRQVSYRTQGGGGPWGGAQTGSWGYGNGGNRTTVVPLTSATDTTSGSVQFYRQVVNSNKKMDALKRAATAFLDATAELNTQLLAADPDAELHQVGLVKFAGTSTNTVGNNTYRDGDNTYNYTQIVSHLVSDFNSLKTAINGFNGAGATRTAAALSHAQTVLSSSAARDNAQKVVIFFTDGEPNQQSGFWPSEAAAAVNNAKTLKDSGALVYTVGVLEDANASTYPNGSANAITAEDINAYLHGVSSNYPNATASSSGTGNNSSWSLTLGARAAGSEYYKVATDADSLKNVFDQIFQAVSTLPASPTVVSSGNPQTSGYVTFVDRLGDFMEVKKVKAIVYNGISYTQQDEPQPNGAVTTYTFQGEVAPNPLSSSRQDLSHIYINVTKGSGDQEGDLVEVLIPAALLPLRYYQLTKDASGNDKLTIQEAYPVHVVYSVGLKSDVKTAMNSGNTDAVDGLTAYIRNNTDNSGKVSFYANAWSKGTTGDTTSQFIPATTNEFYYYTEDTLLYVDKACTTPLTAANIETYHGHEIYYVREHYAIDTDKTVQRETAIPVVHKTDNKTMLAVNNDGQYYIKAGTVKISFSNAENFRLIKPADDAGVVNPTGTASYALYPAWDANVDEALNYLGNNGRIQYVAPGSLAISKTVTADEGLTAPDASFTMQLSITLPETQLNGETMDLDDLGITTVLAPLADGESQPSLSFTADTTTTAANDYTTSFQLKDGQTLTIHGLPSGATYTVQETNIPAGFTQTAATGAQGAIVQGSVQTASFTNNYSVTPVTLNTHVPLVKEVRNGSVTGTVITNWRDDASFRFDLVAVAGSSTVTPPMPTTTQLTVTENNKDNVHFGFENVQFTQPGTYIYAITEYHPALATERLPGINYSHANYRLEVTVTDNGQGALDATTKLLKITDDSNVSQGNGAGVEVESAKFINVYNVENVVAGPTARKVLTDASGSRTLQAGEFQFSITPVGDNAADAPLFPGADDNGTAVVSNTLSGQIDFGQVTFTGSHVKDTENGTTYLYEMREVIPAENKQESGMTYSDTVFTAAVRVFFKTITDPTTNAEQTAVAIEAKYYTGYNTDAQTEVPAANLVFTNTYALQETTAELTVRKTLLGRDWQNGDSFDFTLTAVTSGAPMPQTTDNEGNATVVNTLSVTNKSTPVEATKETLEDGTVKYTAYTDTFKAITFTKTGTYVYAVKETAGSIPGVSYDGHTAYIIVTVSAGSNGQLQASVVYNNSLASTAADRAEGQQAAAFTNRYEAQDVVMTPARLAVQKTFEGRAWTTTDSFVMGIWYEGDIPHPANPSVTIRSSQAGNPVYFDNTNLTYTAAGDYVYYLFEEAGSISGVTYDRTVWKVTVKVIDDTTTGKLEVKSVVYAKGTLGENQALTLDNLKNVTYAEEKETSVASFNNRYEAAPTTVRLQASKTLEAPEGVSLADEQFSFEVYSAEADIGSVEKAVAIAANDAAGQVTFPAIALTEAGTHSFWIKESVNPAAAHITFDTSVYKAEVVVSDPGNGRLAVTSVTYYDAENNEVGIPAFTNRYKDGYTVGEFSVAVTKNLSGRDLNEGEFTFALYDEAGKLVATGTNGVDANDASRGTVELNNIVAAALLLDGAAETPELPDSYPITVTLDNAPTVYVQLNDTALSLTETEQELLAQGENVELNVTVRGTEAGEAEAAQVAELAPGAEVAQYLAIDLAKTVGGVQSAVTETKEAVTLGIAVEEGASRIYRVARIYNGEAVLLPDLDGDGNDTVTIETDRFGLYAILYSELAAAEPEVAEPAAPEAEEPVAPETEEATLPEADVTATEEPATLEVQAEAPVVETVAEEHAADGAAAEETAPVEPTAPVLEANAAQRDALSGNSFRVVSLTVVLPENTLAGEYVYTLREEPGTLGGVDYDESIYTVKVTVSIDNGYLVVSEPSYYDADGNAVAEVVFNNSYVPEKTAPVVIEATKTLLGGRALQNQEFSFVLKDGEGNTVATATNDAEGRVRFELPGFDTADTYTYTMSEVDGDNEDIGYDDNSYTVTVTVTDDLEGQLWASVSYPDDKIPAFENTYSGEATLSLTATKTLEGRELVEGEFEFRVTDETGKVLAIATNGADGSIAFDDILFTAEGEHVLTVSEVKGSLMGVTYDSSVYTVAIKVAYNAERGELEILIGDITGDPLFENSYEEPTTPTTPSPAPGKPSEVPQTGDHSPLGLLAMLTVLAAGGLGAVLLGQKRRNSKG